MQIPNQRSDSECIDQPWQFRLNVNVRYFHSSACLLRNASYFCTPKTEGIGHEDWLKRKFIASFGFIKKHRTFAPRYESTGFQAAKRNTLTTQAEREAGESKTSCHCTKERTKRVRLTWKEETKKSKVFHDSFAS